MEWKDTICFFCDYEAKQRNDCRNLRIECFNCDVQYSLSFDVQRWRFNKKNHQLLYENRATRERFPLTDKQKEFLLNHIKKCWDPEKKKPVIITIDMLDSLPK